MLLVRGFRERVFGLSNSFFPHPRADMSQWEAFERQAVCRVDASPARLTRLHSMLQSRKLHMQNFSNDELNYFQIQGDSGVVRSLFQLCLSTYTEHPPFFCSSPLQS